MKEIKILKFGNDYRFYDSFEVVEKFPNSTFIIKDGGMSGLYFQEETTKVFQEKIFDIDGDFIYHVLSSYKVNQKSVGVLLKGKKGLGKSFTAQRICSSLSLPIIKITSNFNKNTDLFSLLNQIQQEHIIYIDEFDKIFSHRKEKDESSLYNQEDFLSFLDGGNTNNVKKLFLITSNEDVNRYLENRPSRLRYVKYYNKIDSDVVKLIVNELLINTQHKEDLIDNLDLEDLNIDILIQIINEINNLNIPYTKFKSFFNYTPSQNFYKINEEQNGNWVFVKDVMFSDSAFEEVLKVNGRLYSDDMLGYSHYITKVVSSKHNEWIVVVKTYDKDDNPIFKNVKVEKSFVSISKVF